MNKKFPPPKSVHALDANDPADDVKPTPPIAPIETKSDREFGKVAFAPLCPFCTASEGREVRTYTIRTKGPMAYFACKTEGCTFHIKVARPWREKRSNAPDVNVAARPDMH